MNDEEKTRMDIYLSYRGSLDEVLQSNIEQYDKAILTLSSGALALSLTVIKDLVPFERASFIGILITSWILFSGSIVSTLCSFVFGQMAVSTQIDYATKFYLEKKAEYFDKKNPWTGFTKILNFASGVMFIFGVVLTVFFVYTNLGKKEIDMSKEKAIITKELFIKGLVPPKMVPLPQSILPGVVDPPLPDAGKVPPPMIPIPQAPAPPPPPDKE